MPNIKIDELDNLVRLMEKKNIYYVDLKNKGRHIRMRRSPETVLNRTAEDDSAGGSAAEESLSQDKENNKHNKLYIL